MDAVYRIGEGEEMRGKTFDISPLAFPEPI